MIVYSIGIYILYLLGAVYIELIYIVYAAT